MRCCSSVFERSIRELQGVRSLFEPHQTPFYFGPERQQQIPSDKDLHLLASCNSQMYTYDYADQLMLADFVECSAVFVRDMAAYIPKERFSRYIEGDFSDFKHSFLIRDPRKAIPSQWKACMRSGFDFAIDEGTGMKGFAKLYELFEFIRSTGREVSVIDAADLLKNPEYIMELYCRQTGLPYDKKMLTWTPGEVKDWTSSKYYKEWHWNAMYSSGFGTLTPPHDIPQFPSVPENIPAIVEEEIEKSIPFYEVMHNYCVQL